MAITFDQVSLGSNAIDSTATSITLTTTQTVAPGALIVLASSCGALVVINAPSGGGLTWTVDSSGQASGATSGFASAPAPAGLASGTVLTANFSASTVGRAVCGFSLLGVDASALDVASGPTGFSATNPWTGASTTIKAGSILLANAHCVITNETSTPTAPSNELFDFGAGAGTFDMTVCYRIESVAGAYTVAGHWDASANETGTVQGVAYKAAPVAGQLGHASLPFMSSGRI